MNTQEKIIAAALLALALSGCSHSDAPPSAPVSENAPLSVSSPAPPAPVVLASPTVRYMPSVLDPNAAHPVYPPGSNVPPGAPAAMVPQPDGRPPDINRGYVPAQENVQSGTNAADSIGLPPPLTSQQAEAESRLPPDQRFALDKPRFVQTLQWQQRQIAQGKPALIPYRIDSSGHITHLEPNGTLAPVSDRDLEYPSEASRQESMAALRAAQSAGQ